MNIRRIATRFSILTAAVLTFVGCGGGGQSGNQSSPASFSYTLDGSENVSGTNAAAFEPTFYSLIGINGGPGSLGMEITTTPGVGSFPLIADCTFVYPPSNSTISFVDGSGTTYSSNIDQSCSSNLPDKATTGVIKLTSYNSNGNIAGTFSGTVYKVSSSNPGPASHVITKGFFSVPYPSAAGETFVRQQQ